jgi:hypothetical protein
MYLYMSINTKTDLDMVMSIHSFIHSFYLPPNGAYGHGHGHENKSPLRFKLDFD